MKMQYDNQKTYHKKDYDITVLLLTYNHEKTIEKCIQSLLQQKTKFSYIIKILDDASTDGTTAICMDYAQRYPKKIEYVLQPHNTGGKHFYDAIKSVQTKYWCFIDGDDYWIDTKHIQKGITFLNGHEDYTLWGQNTLFKTPSSECDYTKYILNRTNVSNPITLDNYLFMHPASRIYRKIIDYNTEFKGLLLSDLPLYFTHLTKGKAYYEDSIGGVYNWSQTGYYSQLSERQRQYNLFLAWKHINEVTKFLYEASIIKQLEEILFKKHIKTLKNNALPPPVGVKLKWSIVKYKLKKSLLRDARKKTESFISKMDKRFAIRK